MPFSGVRKIVKQSLIMSFHNLSECVVVEACHETSRERRGESKEAWCLISDPGSGNRPESSRNQPQRYHTANLCFSYTLMGSVGDDTYHVALSLAVYICFPCLKERTMCYSPLNPETNTLIKFWWLWEWISEVTSTFDHQSSTIGWYNWPMDLIAV